MEVLYNNKEAEILFQASGSMKLLRVWIKRVAMQTERAWNDTLPTELQALKIAVIQTENNVNKLCVSQQSAALQSFREKMQELLVNIDTKEMKIIQSICITIQNQIDYIVNDLDKRRRCLYERLI